MVQQIDVMVIGAGAAGLMCAIEAAKRGRHVLVIDSANKPGKKILMSGGGRCNFTNLHIAPDAYLCGNRHFVKSALSRYTQWDFIAWVKKHKIPYHEKKHGQLFCDHKAKAILNMLLTELDWAGAQLHLKENIKKIKKEASFFDVHTDAGQYRCASLVIASGGLSIPTLGASPFGYKVAEQFNIKVKPTRAGLVPFTLHVNDKNKAAELAGVSHACEVRCQQARFKEDILFTHRGLSGPAILQISSYWHPGDPVVVDFFPDTTIEHIINKALKTQPHSQVKTLFSSIMAKRLVEHLLPEQCKTLKISALQPHHLKALTQALKHYSIVPNGTEGYRTAEVTLGGVDCDAISSKTMECLNVKGLYFIGEVLDVAGWLGGYNFQWAWSSGWAAGQFV